MRLTKLGHSCVLVETNDRVALFDPGAWATHLNVSEIKRLDRIVYTHPHADHFDIENLKKLLQKFPDVHVISHPAIAKLIKEADIDVVLREESDCVTKFEAPHEQVPVLNAPPIPENGYHFKGLFTHAGDSHTFSESKKVLAIGVVAPWGSTTDAVKQILKVEPNYVLPIHDWQYTDEARTWLDNLLSNALADSGITLLPSTPGLTHEID